MKHQTAALEGALLDAAVAKALGGEVLVTSGRPRFGIFVLDDGKILERVEQGSPLLGQPFFVRSPDSPDEPPPAWSPSRRWEHGGPIIQRERIAIFANVADWTASVDDDGSVCRLQTRAPTPLIAAMRAYVASKLGEEIEL